MSSVYAIIGLILAPSIAVLVYYYKSTVTYDVICLHERFDIQERIINLPKDYGDYAISLASLGIKNIGWKNVEKLEVQADFNFGAKIIKCEVNRTTSVAKSTVICEFENNSLFIRCVSLPRNEKIKIQIMMNGFGSIPTITGGDPNYVAKSVSDLGFMHLIFRDLPSNLFIWFLVSLLWFLLNSNLH